MCCWNSKMTNNMSLIRDGLWLVIQCGTQCFLSSLSFLMKMSQKKLHSSSLNFIVIFKRLNTLPSFVEIINCMEISPSLLLSSSYINKNHINDWIMYDYNTGSSTFLTCFFHLGSSKCVASRSDYVGCHLSFWRVLLKYCFHHFHNAHLHRTAQCGFWDSHMALSDGPLWSGHCHNLHSQYGHSSVIFRYPFFVL